MQTAAFTQEVNDEHDEHVELPITGMTCASCANRIERRLNKLDGVTATVNYATEKATRRLRPGARSRPSLVAAVEAAGYQRRCRPPSRRPRGAEPDETDAAARAGWSSRAAVAPVLLLSMIPALQFDNWQWLSLQLATPVVLWGGWPFHRAAWANLRARHGDDGHAHPRRHARRVAVVAVRAVPRRRRHARDADAFDLIPDAGEGADQIYLEIAAVVTTFILAGRYFEARAKRRAGAALKALLELGAKDVAVLDADGDRAPHPGRAAAGRRPLRRPPGREGRHRRRRRGGHARRRHEHC